MARFPHSHPISAGGFANVGIKRLVDFRFDVRKGNWRQMGSERQIGSTMAHTLFTCPSTELKVQHWLDDDEDAPETEYEAITCKACARLHLINRRTGRLLGQED